MSRVWAGGGRPVEFPPKTRTSRRSVEIDRSTLDELRRWRRQFRRDGLPCGPDDWMFCNTTGRFLNPESRTTRTTDGHAPWRPSTPATDRCPPSNNSKNSSTR
jgi:hypothetical protein